jgi:hypothetical protein
MAAYEDFTAGVDHVGRGLDSGALRGLKVLLVVEDVPRVLFVIVDEKKLCATEPGIYRTVRSGIFRRHCDFHVIISFLL